MKHYLVVCSGILLACSAAYSRPFVNPGDSARYWKITSHHSIVWDVARENRLPHSDHMEMAGRKVAALVTYSMDDKKMLTLRREILFPQLRIHIKTSDPDWKNYRAYFRNIYTDEMLPVITLNGKTLVPGPVDSVEIGGKLTFYHKPVDRIQITRTLLPSMTERLFAEHWELKNTGGEPLRLYIGSTLIEKQEEGIKGNYIQKAYCEDCGECQVGSGQSKGFTIFFAAGMDGEETGNFDYSVIAGERDDFLAEMQHNLILETPDPTLNTLFYFSKIRTAESIFDTKMGLVHSPGGGNYYCGIWANDQVEYSGPFFPFLGYTDGNTAAYNCYRWFMHHIPANDSPISSSFEMEGDLPCCGRDRGDAAMLAYGTSQYALYGGDRDRAKELWPLIEWSIRYCDKKTNAQGVIRSETDEMEGRIATGDANLATSSLYYGGLKNASLLAGELGFSKEAALYKNRAVQLAIAIENHFGAKIENLDTYRYFDGNKYLRHWICLPLVMGIQTRQPGTVDALLNKLWTSNGVLVEYNPEDHGPKVFWDRGTLYALRGTFKSGAVDLSLAKLTGFSEKRLLGDHVPYVVEAYPENDMQHLSAESALYCRIFTEGLLGIEPAGLNSFTMAPRMPATWNKYSLQKMHILGKDLSVFCMRASGGIHVKVSDSAGNRFDRIIPEGRTVKITLD